MQPGLDELIAWDHAHLWHPFTCQSEWLVGEPLVIERAEGVYLYDRDGRRYLDGVSSLWCNVHGHRHPMIDAALRTQIERLAHSTLLGLTHEPAIMLARRLVERAPLGLTRVFFSDNGATAVEVALKMAFQYWRQKPNPEPRRNLFIALDGAYHGDTLGDVSVGGVARFHGMFAPLLFPTLRAPAPHPYRWASGASANDCRSACLSAVESLLLAHAGEVVAVVVEPLVQCAAGMIVHPPDYLKGLRELCDRHDTLLIADEVAVGFGRTGKMFACEHEAVSPDFLCLAKGITGGYLPLAATLTTERVFSAYLGPPEAGTTFFHGHTYGGNPLAAAAALANLQVFDQEKTLDHLQDKVNAVSGRLERWLQNPHVGDIRQSGLIVGIELVRDRATKEPFPHDYRMGARVCARARNYRLISRPLGDVLVLMPPLSSTIDQLGQMVDALEQALEDELMQWNRQ